MKSKSYVNMHSHSGFSVGDAMGSPSEHLEEAFKTGNNAHAFTDHGNMSNMANAHIHQQKMLKEGRYIKYIPGIESYFVPSIQEWRNLREEKRLEKSATKSAEKKLIKSLDEEESNTLIENEEETKSKEKNPLYKRSHLVLLAKNSIGLKNLCQLTTKSHTGDNFYKMPRIDFDLLREHSEGLVVLTACLGGPLVGACDFWEQDERKTKEKQREMVQKFQKIFGENFFLELQWNAIPEQHQMNNMIIELSKEFSIPLVSTADCHYPKKELWKDREIYKQLAWMKDGNSIKELPDTIEKMKYQLYPKNYEQMVESFENYSKDCNQTYDRELILSSISRTQEIVDTFEDIKFDTSINLPIFANAPGKTADETLREIAFSGLRKKNKLNSEYEQRLDYELSVISKRKMSEYFLVQKEITNIAERTQLVGLGRGSAAGSLLSYCIDLTKIDPIRFGLQFERFLLPDSTDLPDIDTDFEEPAALKAVLQKEWKEKYNVDVIPITNYNTLQLRSLIKDLSKMEGIDFQEVNQVTSKMTIEATPSAKKKNNIESGAYTPTFEELLEFSPTLISFLEKYPNVEKHIKNLQGEKKSVGLHAAGIVIGENISHRLPLIARKGMFQTPFAEGQTIRELESMGFPKIDLLGLATLRVIHSCIERILEDKNQAIPLFDDVKDWYNINIHPDVIDFNDKKVYENVFHCGKWPSIFQFTNSGAQDFCKRSLPSCLEDLSVITALYRPGPMASFLDKKYLDIIEGNEKVSYIHPILEDILKTSKGLCAFQEQIAGIVHKLGKDISLTDGNKLRKLLTKRGTPAQEDIKEKLKNKFNIGCLEKGLTRDQSNDIWVSLQKYSQYSFNKSHSSSCGAISFQCAYLLTYHPSEWLASYLDEETQDDSGKSKAISTVKSLGYNIEPPNINNSGYKWSVSSDKQTFYQPLSSIKGMGDKAVEQVVNNRPYKKIEDLILNENIVYSKLNKKGLSVLARCGATDSLMDNRFTGKKHFWMAFCNEKPKTQKKFDEYIELHKLEGDFLKEERIDNFNELLGFYPIDMIMSRQLYKRLEENKILPISKVDKENDNEELKLCWFIPNKFEIKLSKNNKSYYVVQALDDTGKITEIKCWAIDPKIDIIYLNRPYVSKLKYDEKYGNFSCIGISKSWKMIG